MFRNLQHGVHIDSDDGVFVSRERRFLRRKQSQILKIMQEFCVSATNVLCDLDQDNHGWDNKNKFEFEVSTNGSVVPYVFGMPGAAMVLLIVINSEFI